MQLITIKETAEFLRTSRKTVDVWLCIGTLPRDRISLKIGRKVLIIKDELIKFINEKRPPVA